MKERTGETILMTGATGLLGRATLGRLLRLDPSRRVVVLVRDVARWELVRRSIGVDATRIVPVVGDVTQPMLGLDRDVLGWLAPRLTSAIHLAADTCFSQTLDHARAVNVEGTRQLLALAAECPNIARLAQVSTAFVAGRRTGLIAERADAAEAGWVNAYERSKWEAEQLVQTSDVSWTMLRSSTVVCDDCRGGVTQRNAVHRALGLLHGGLAPMLPGAEDSPVDFVTTAYVADAVARLALAPASDRATFHLCAGAGAIPLGELLDRALALWSRDAGWRRRAIARPTLCDLATWNLFRQSVEEVADARLVRVTRALAHFAPQLALPKRFDTRCADDALGTSAPPARDYIDHVLAWLAADRLPLTRDAAA